ncbi:MAG: VOC family protein [Alphaproteobacteria bacterium]|nr:VOC family protein [Alphaproteobacteria bacterium]MBV9540485.1 VOC family protein [Alphaproteobacteria bacterium]MBV9903284.1 VOC family protein [Alphaproteobacteria bacterium]
MANKEFDLQGVNHLALVCKDMARTVDFYTNILGMPLIKTIELPGGRGQHFFFDIGNGDSLAFFWFPDAPEAVPGVASAMPHLIPGTSAHGSMNHVAINVPADKIDEYHKKLVEKGVKCSPVISHDDSPQQASLEITPTTFVRSIYFYDPDGIGLEFACWNRTLGAPSDVAVKAAKADDKQKYLEPAQ